MAHHCASRPIRARTSHQSSSESKELPPALCGGVSRTHGRRILTSLLVALAFATTLVATANAAEPRTSGVDVQHFRPGGGGFDFLGISGGFLAPHLDVNAALLFHHSDVLLLHQRQKDDPRQPVLKSQDILEVMGSIAFLDRLELGIAIPLVLGQSTGSGFGLTPGLEAPGGATIGDIRVTPKVKLFETRRQFALTLAAPLTLPTGSDFGGYGSFIATPMAIADWRPAHYFRLTTNAGARLRKTTRFDTLKLGNEAVFGAGIELSFNIVDQRFAILANYLAAVPFDSDDREPVPMEVDMGVAWRTLPNWSVELGFGTGTNRGYGAPDLRVFVGARFATNVRCLNGPEDIDGFEDDDGCAEPDNDGDGIDDTVDRCPFEAETINGVRDDDGCPDEANDHADQLVSASADSDADPDNDGIPNRDDSCPNEAEDNDGFADTDGCPEFDNDDDGVQDAADKCPDVAEVINNHEDEDGCPDAAPEAAPVQIIGGKLVLRDAIHFQTNRDVIKSESFALLTEVSNIIKAHPKIRRLRIEGHTDDRGPDGFNRRLSERRADAVKRFLVEAGIAPSRLVSQGFGETRPIADNDSDEGRAANRRVEFFIDEMVTP